MLTRRQTAIMLRCSSCGGTSLFPISVFTLGSSRREFRCACGRHILTISRRGPDVWTQLACFLCEGVHLFKFSNRDFWSREIKSILCPDTGAEIGYIGPPWNIMRLAGTRDELLPKVASLFRDPAAGLRALTKILELDDQGKMRCATCNNLLDVEVYSEGVEICCSACSTTLAILVGDRESPDERGRRRGATNARLPASLDATGRRARSRVGVGARAVAKGKKTTRAGPKRRG
ncbi:MAG: hypothetical protein NUV93_01780 [Firmicutes bacterium]|jgi:hypothetical protein|nr:hypothetical protein [Bacillota bacterium]